MILKVTAEKLKQMMEAQWETGGCESPLQLARWILDGEWLEPNNERFIPDPDLDLPLPAFHE